VSNSISGIVSGSEWLSFLYKEEVEEGTPFFALLNLGSLLEEKWNSIEVDSDSSKKDYTWKSTEAFSLQSKYSETGSDAKGTYAGSTKLSSAYSGFEINATNSGNWGNYSSQEKETIIIIYTGSSGDGDDYSYKYKWDSKKNLASEKRLI